MAINCEALEQSSNWNARSYNSLLSRCRHFGVYRSHCPPRSVSIAVHLTITLLRFFPAFVSRLIASYKFMVFGIDKQNATRWAVKLLTTPNAYTANRQTAAAAATAHWKLVHVRGAVDMAFVSPFRFTNYLVSSYSFIIRRIKMVMEFVCFGRNSCRTTRHVSYSLERKNRRRKHPILSMKSLYRKSTEICPRAPSDKRKMKFLNNRQFSVFRPSRRTALVDIFFGRLSLSLLRLFRLQLLSFENE